MKDNWKVTVIDEKLMENLIQLLEVDTVTAQILCSRNLCDPEDARRFLNPSASQLFSPFLMKDMVEAVSLLRDAVSNKKKIGIFCDSDLDGLTSLSVLYTLFTRMGIDIFYHFPNADNSDYGLTPPVTDLFIKNGTELLITLDCGIRDIEEIGRLRGAGIAVIVCDHHEPDETLPDAVVVDPKRRDCGYPFKELARVGVAFKMLQAFVYSYMPLYNRTHSLLVRDGDRFDMMILHNGIIDNSSYRSFYYPEEYCRFADPEMTCFYYRVSEDEMSKTGCTRYESVDSLISQSLCAVPEAGFRDFINERLSWGDRLINAVYDIFCEVSFLLPEKCRFLYTAVLPYVAIGTIADVVSVTGENRVLITRGIDCFNSSDEPSLARLKSFVKSKIDHRVIGWQIAPLLNSPGRFGRTELTADFMTGTDNSETVFDTIYSINEYRKKNVTDMFDRIVSEMDSDLQNEKIIFISTFEIEEGLTGLLAARLNDHYSRPAIVATAADGIMYKGSGRSRSFALFPYIEELAPLFVRYGGHQQAFGFTIDQKKLPELKQALVALGDKISGADMTLTADMELDYRRITASFIRDLSGLEPFGTDHEPPLFLARCVPVVSVSSFGKRKEHGRILTDMDNLEIVGWRIADKMQQAALKGTVDVLFYPELNTYFGRSTVRMLVCDID
ncbi:MAG: single-stranded-DNA-specific exonuclease RecJ [Spirochaetota bacterium]